MSIFGGAAFGQFAFGEQVDDQIDSAAFTAFLDEITSPRCWLLELDVLALGAEAAGSGAFMDAAFGERAFGDGGAAGTTGTVTLRFSSHGYMSHAADSPTNTWYEGRLSPPTVDRRIVASNGIGGLTEVFAEVALLNGDGDLDDLLDNYAIDGRQARIYFGRSTDALSDFGLEFTGVVSTSTIIGEQEVKIKLSDGAAKLSSAIINETAYAGSGGLEGGADIAGRPKPVGWGSAQNIAPPLVDSALLIYQVHDGAISDVPAAYDRQVVLTKGADYASEADMNANAPAAGYYRVLKSGGYFRLGSTPAGTVTCDALLDASGSGYIDTLSDIVFRILTTYVGLASTEIEPASFDRLGNDVTAEIGHWIGTEVTYADRVIDELLAKCGCFGGFNRQGAFTVGLIARASGSPHMTFDTTDVIKLTREPLPASVAPIIWRAAAGYQRNYNVMTDVAASVTAARRTFAAEELRFSVSSDLTIQTQHLLARELTAGGLYAQSADADAEALRLFNLWGSERAMYRMTTRPRGLTCDLGRVVLVTYPRHGFNAGKSGRVLSHTVRGYEVEMLLLC